MSGQDRVKPVCPGDGCEGCAGCKSSGNVAPPETTAHEAQAREAFEREECKSSFRTVLNVTFDGRYENRKRESRWETWLAAWTAALASQTEVPCIPQHHREMDTKDPALYPASDAEHDPANDPIGGRVGHAIKRLRFAYVFADPRAPDQMALAWRLDIGALLSEYVRLKAYSELLAEKNEALASCPADDGAREDAGWIKTTDRLPEKPGKERYEYVDCLIFYKGEVLKRPWNCEHLCWDDEHYDDFFAHPAEPTHWMPLPPAPIVARADGGAG